MDIFVTILEQGLIYGILALGVYITYKILDFPDLTVDGSFPLGAAVTATMITSGVNPYLTIPVSFSGGSSSRNLYRTDPCQRKGQGSPLRYHYDDCAVDDQSQDCRKSKCSDILEKRIFSTIRR